VIGPHPERRPALLRVANQAETLLLVPALLAGALPGRGWLAPVLLLGLLTVGAARTGADRGGGVVLAAAFLFVGLRLDGVRVTGCRFAAIGATGARAAPCFRGRRDGRLEPRVPRVRTWTCRPRFVRVPPLPGRGRGAVALIGAFALFALGLSELVWLATRRPRPAVLEALLVGLAVSPVVNDSPYEIAFYSALPGLALWVWCRSGDIEAARPVGARLCLT
jgi:hypothetical protein